MCSFPVNESGRTGAAFEIFADKATGRGTILYARYDGHYAVLRPSVPLWQEDWGTSRRGRHVAHPVR